ncbi:MULTISPECIES: stage II sporulation protein M [unclassified Mesorhizobium]|uniref:stage II sporulation protein M n=1 Tax=unclassified Mesorhizobium TaxID=325217 RepID=UPI00112AC05C|nr:MULTISPECIES: stage II sporulation protein M [unclassified Mesorhizobium]TPN54008.1 stage II sporulation protein M [Mesorhizobium sp. B1-1-7]TPN54303.1 stage II sporulation protein M [Mesorhizobium sp. B1-1-9]
MTLPSGTDAVRQSLASFRQEREADWKAFEALLARVEKRAPRTLSEDELLSLPLLYRSALSSLSVARATSLDSALIAYLEALCLRGYFYLYGAKRGLRQRVGDFFLRDWPAAIRDLWRETSVSVGLTLVGAIAGYWLVASDKRWYDAIIAPSLAGGRNPDSSVEALRSVLYDGGSSHFLSGFAAYLFTHNTQVAILAFALGFAFAVPSVLIILMNGCMLGALFQVYAAKGLGFELGGWLSIHGTTELFAIALAGAAGMRIGTRIAFPGESTRMAAAAQAGQVAATVMVGVMVMLLFAGLLEGIGRQTIASDATRYAIGGGMLTLWIAYFYLFRMVRHGNG